MASWNRGTSGGSTAATEQIMEAENDRLADQLAAKVSRLKMISLDVKDDVDDQNKYLDGMDSDFMSTTGLLGGTVTRFNNMIAAGRGNRKMMCYLIGFLVALFFILYFALSRTKT